MSTMALLTTTPAREMMPIMVMMITKSCRKTTSPRKTPVRENSTLKPMMNGVEMLLNWATMIRKMRKRAMTRARDRKAISLACSSCCPVNSHWTPFSAG